MRSMKLLSIVVVFVCLALSFVGSVSAGTIVVDTLADGIGVAGCSLREAITRANTGSDGEGCTGVSSSPNTINLSATGSYTLTTGSALPSVTTDITIQESNGATAIIEAETTPNTAAYRVMSVNGTFAVLTLDGVTVRHGGTTSTALTGGCILVTNASDLVLRGGTVVEQCNTSGNGGAIYAISAVNTINVTNSTIQNNRAGGSGGGIFWDSGTVTVSGSTFSDNVASNGGAIYAVSNSGFSVSSSTFSSNEVNGSGFSAAGGAIFFGMSFGMGTISGSTFTNNSVSGSSSNDGGAIFKTNASTLEITDSVFTGNSVTGSGGDGGVFSVGLGTLRVISSRMENNSSVDTVRGDVLRVIGGSGIAVIRASCIVNNGDIAIYGNENNDVVARDTVSTNDNWWGTEWGPLISGVTGSQYSNGDSINGTGMTGSFVDVAWSSGGDEDQVPPTGEWLTVAPTVAGEVCMSCLEVSSIGHARSCS